MSLTRRESDVASGIDLIKEDYPSYSEGDLTRHFMCFKEYDLDGTGFITPENLKAILDTMDDAVVITIEEVQGMIAEVAVLCEHPNDGKLSFRDYMKCMEYERIKDEHNAKVEAAAEEVVSHILDASMREPSVREGEDSGAAIEEPVREEVVPELLKRASMAGEEVDADAARGLCQSMLELEVAKEPELAPEAPPAAAAAAEGAAAEEAPQQLMRGTSFKVFDNLAKKRIAAFTTAVEEKKADAEKSERAVEGAVDDFKDRMARFKRIEAKTAPKGPGEKPKAACSVYDDNVHLQTLKNKCAAFEEAGKRTEVVAKKSWGVAGPGGQYHKKTIFVDAAARKGPPPKVNLFK